MTNNKESLLECYEQINDVFVEYKQKSFMENQDIYIKTLRKFLKELDVLRQQDESKGLPYLSYTINFLNHLLELDDGVEFLKPFEKFSNYLFDDYLAELTKKILDVSICHSI